MKINKFSFLHQKAEMHGFAAKFILDISKNNNSAARLNIKTSKN